MASLAPRRLAKELKDLNQDGPPAGCQILSADNFEEWRFQLSVLGKSCYENEKFQLRFKFTKGYPLESPEVTFVVGDGWQAPIFFILNLPFPILDRHGHCYSNGHICASILGNEWSPVLTVFSVLISLQSMLASSPKRERPPDNEQYVKRAPASPKDARFVYHDDKV